MKKIFLSLLVLVVSFTSFAQNATDPRNCGSMEHLNMLLQQDPTLADRMQQIEQFTQDYISTHPANQERAVITIPVVFHIVYNTTAQNISDAKCQAQLNQLNLDFARLNTDASNTPAAFQSLGANTQIQFCFAQRDPSGNATTGIERRSTTTTSFSSNNAIKYYANGGLNAWNASSYLNIWSGNLSGGLLGYAQFPGGPAATDGVVLLYSSIGSMLSPGTATNYALGRTATHEVGHYFNLRHIWGDATCGSDLVNDTPTQQTSNGGCPSFPHTTCSNGANGDMFMNYMDYTYDNCMNIFTTGQSTRMNATLASGGGHYSLSTSLGCTPPSGGGTCGTPVSLSSSGVTTSAATLSWATVSGATSYNVQYKISSASTWTTTTSTVASKSLTGLTANTTYNFQVQAVCATTGSYSSVASFTTLSSGGGCTDIYESNNSASASKLIPVNTAVTGLISTSTDIDWFHFSNTSSSTKIKITLTNLPFDYDVRLYNSSGTTLLATSQNGGTTSETIIYNTTTVGTYKIRVYGYGGVYSATSCYTLNALISGTNFRTIDNGTVEIIPAENILNLYPNPTANKLTVDYISTVSENITINVYDVLGRKVYSEMNTANAGSNTYYQDFNNLENGFYILEINNGTTATIKRFMMEK